MDTAHLSFVLVHGAWHGAFVWQNLLLRLRALGHTAAAWLGGGGVQPGRAAGGADERQQRAGPRLMPSARTAVRGAARLGRPLRWW